jgi:undecaprenyl diphosphate synthase
MSSPENIPRHIAIIPDGNRRWAKVRGLEPWQGHEAGAETIEALTRKARKLGIQELSFWGSSIENLTKRPILERKALLRIYSEHFKRLLGDEDVFREKMRVRVIGRWREQFPAVLKKLLEEVEEKTRDHDAYFLNFFLAYSGVDDMMEAFRSVAKDAKTAVTDLTEETVKAHLMTRELPPVDLLIRTGGEPHLSAGFMMWDIADSQLFFSPKLFPDFGAAALEEAVIDYGNRVRRFGK